jgi:PAS domain S-box-containing protein
MSLFHRYRYAILIIGGIIIGAASIFLLFDLLNQQTKPYQSPEIPYQPDHPTLRVGLDDSFPPYEYLTDGNPSGYNIDVMNAVARVSGYNIIYVAKPWGQIIDDLNQGNIDILSGMFISNKRKETYTFSNPHTFVASGLFTQRDSPIQTLDDLTGKKVFVQKSDIMEDYLREQAMDLTILMVDNPEEVLIQLSEGKADAGLLSSISQGQYFITTYQLTNLEIHNLDLPARAYAFSALKANQIIIDRLDEGLTLIQATGEFDAINTKWFFTYQKEDSLITLRIILYSLFGLIVLLLISVAWSNSLNKQVDYKTADLLRSEARFRVIFENASEGIAIIYQDKIIFANPKAIEIMELQGVPLDSVDFFSIPHPSERQRLKDYYQIRKTGIAVPNQYTYKILTHKTHQERWLMNNVIQTMWDNKDVLLIFFNDITELRTSEAALERSEERLKLAMEASNDGIWDFNILAGESYFSPRYYSMLGYQNHEFPAGFKSWIELLHPDDREMTIRVLNQLLDQPDGHPHELTFRMKTRDGSYRWILSKFKITAYELGVIPKRISGVHTDITAQKEFEETIRQERDVLDQIMRTSNNAFIVTDKKGIVKYINPTAEKMLHQNENDLLGKRYTDISINILDTTYKTLLDPGKLLRVIKKSPTPVYNLERIIIQGDREYHILLNAAKLTDSQGAFDGMVVSIIDVTDSHRIKQELIERDKRIHQIIQHNPVGVAMLDNQLNYLTTSDQFVNYFHLDAKNLRNQNAIEHTPFIYRKWKTVFEAALQGEEQEVFQDEFLQPDNKLDYFHWVCKPWFKEQNQIGGILFYTQLITDQVLAYQALEFSESKFAKTFHTSPDSIYINRLADGMYIDVNSGFLEMTGYTREETIGKTSKELNIWHNPEDRLILTKQIEEKGEAQNIEAPFRMKDGSIRYGLMSARIIEVNHEICIVTITRDITSTRQINEKIKQMNLELEARIQERTIELERKNQELETFTYTVSHDLKAPLRGIDGYSRLLIEDFHDKLPPEGQFFLQNIRNSTLHMEKLINDLLTYSRMERRSVVFKEVDIEELIKRILNDYIPNLHQSMVIMNLQVTKVHSDYESLMQILRNLIDNAFKFARKDTAHQVEINSYEEDAYCIIKIKDNGIGFDNKYKDNIFKIFNRLHNQDDYPGTGIGLTIVKKGIERINGKISAIGEVNIGAEFTLSIPLSNKGNVESYDI